MSGRQNGSKESTAQSLADAHFRLDASLVRVLRVRAGTTEESMPDEPVKLLEINKETPRNGIVPVFFGADPAHGIQHSCIIVEIAPDEFEDLRAGRLELPDGWTIAEEILPQASV